MKVSVLPWAGINQRIDVGRVSFFPATMLEEMSLDVSSNEMSWFMNYLNCFRAGGMPASSVSLATVDGKIRDFTLEEEELLNSAISALIYAIVCPRILAAVRNNKQSHELASSERFMIYQVVLNEFGALQIRANSLNMEPWETLVEHRPGFINYGRPTPAQTYLDPILKLFSLQTEPAKRILRSLYFFARAQANGVELPEFSKLVFLATAFEILYDCVDLDSEKRKYVMNTMRCFWKGSSEEGTVIYGGKKNQLLPNAKKQRNVLAACWYDQFYELRSRFVHGELLSESELVYPCSKVTWTTHREIAAIVYAASVEEFIAQIDKNQPLANQYLRKHVLKHFFEPLGWTKVILDADKEA